MYYSSMPEFAAFMLRVLMGMFFLISGYHKLFNVQRHAAITQTMVDDHVPEVKFNSWFVPMVEFSGGLALIFGFLVPLAAFGLFTVCVVATLVDGLKRIVGWHPLDDADYVDDVLYLPEVLYSFILITIVLLGSGPFSIDRMIAQYHPWWGF